MHQNNNNNNNIERKREKNGNSRKGHTINRSRVGRIRLALFLVAGS